jgi:hypothetical protein
VLSERAENVGDREFPFHGTCDQCAQGDRDLRSASDKFPDAWICAECIGAHDRALNAAVDAVMADWALFRSPRSGGTELVRSEVHTILGQAITTYLEFDHD